jgi:hypothetical protein
MTTPNLIKINLSTGEVETGGLWDSGQPLLDIEFQASLEFTFSKK